MTDFLADDSTSKLMRKGWVKTSSRLYKFWLSKVRGFKVTRKVQTPMGYSMGRLTYRTSWVLKPRDK